ncbi:MAG: methyl-accepting chemotaxis protein [Lysinibacillus sp.]|nr:methyl-accepting chemotaxis protein [Lysinibacillus sp.]
MGIKGIGGKLTTSIVLLLIFTCGALGIFSYANSSKEVIHQVETTLTWKAEDVSAYIEEFIKRVHSEIEAIADHSEIQSMDFERQALYLNEKLKQSEDYLAFGIVDSKGISHYLDGSTADLSDRDYIQEAFKGQTAMSDTIISRVTNEPVIMIATPIHSTNGEQALLLARIDGYFLSSIVEQITIGESGYAFIINEEGTFQGHPNREYVKEQMNFLHSEDSNNSDQATLIQEMIQQDQGFRNYITTDGKESYVSYYTLQNGWKMGIVAYKNEVLSGLNSLKLNLMLTSIIIIVIGIALGIFISNRVSNPIKHVVHISEQLAAGDFTHEVPNKFKKRTDELGVLSRELSKMVASMKEMIKKVEKNAVHVNETSEQLKTSVNHVTNMSKNIASAIQEVSVASESQSYAANESAISMEQMAKEIQHVAEVATNVAEHTNHIVNKVNEGHKAVQHSIEQMSAIQEGTAIELEAIRKLEKESNEISLISKVISEISDQTNLLALNASIEAARAGEAGKGFAIVAEEVRKLSEQTAESVAQINALIEKIQAYTEEVVNAAEAGEENVRGGIESINMLENQFEEIVHSVDEIGKEITNLTEAAQLMSANAEEVTASIEEMSASANNATEYVQEVTTATDSQLQSVEEMNENVRELAAGATELSKAVSQFKLES